MKNIELIKLIVFFSFFSIFLVILVFAIRKLFISSFHRRCRALGLRPSPRDSFYCLGHWQDARVVVERCGTKYCNTIYVFMDLGNLPTEAMRNIGYFMQGLQREYFTVRGFEPDSELNKIVSGSWRGLYLYSGHLRTNATAVDMKRLCETLYQIRTELRRRIFSVG
jgi:hypothetical protein